MDALTKHRICVALVLPLAGWLVRCAPRVEPRTPAVSQAWQNQRQARSSDDVGETSPRGPVATRDLREKAVQDPEAAEPPIATVDGWPIARHRVVDLLLRSHGVGVLEQLIVLDAAERVAEEMGLAVTPADVDREYRRALEHLGNPVSAVAPDSFNPASAERLLEEVLSRRNISREEYLLVIRRNAILRLIVEAELEVDSEQISAEFERLYGQRVQVRHIQLATLAEVGRVQERLAAGEDFATVAGTYSANEASAQVGGLLAPFSQHDAEVPAILRKAAFALEPGELSDALRVGEWYHLLQLVAVLPVEDVAVEQVQGRVERSLRERLSEPAMRERYERLFREADVVIYDPVLREAFERKHPPSATPTPPG